MSINTNRINNVGSILDVIGSSFAKQYKRTGRRKRSSRSHLSWHRFGHAPLRRKTFQKSECSKGRKQESPMDCDSAGFHDWKIYISLLFQTGCFDFASSEVACCYDILNFKWTSNKFISDRGSWDYETTKDNRSFRSTKRSLSTWRSYWLAHIYGSYSFSLIECIFFTASAEDLVSSFDARIGFSEFIRDFLKATKRDNIKLVFLLNYWFSARLLVFC